MSKLETQLLIMVAKYCLWLVRATHRKAEPINPDTLAALIGQVGAESR